MNIYNKIRKSIAYRRAKSTWHQLAIHHSFDTYTGKSVYLQELDVLVKEEEFLQLLEGLDLAKKLKEHSVEFEIKESKLLIKVCGLKFEIQTAEELFIAKEIFIDRCYEFHTNSETIVLDVGMNVGMASLFFAQQADVVSVFSFEPFKPTFNQSKVNISLNPKYSGKISSFNKGLGKKKQVLDIEYSKSNRGRTGVLGTELIKNRINDIKIETICIEPASIELANILKEINENQEIVLKMDCEGAEFDIIQNMDEHDLFSKISMVMMEWHGNEPAKIEKVLLQHGYRLFKHVSGKNLGMIYAAK